SEIEGGEELPRAPLRDLSARNGVYDRQSDLNSWSPAFPALHVMGFESVGVRSFPPPPILKNE
ncbi:unnamed protein product, partial [Amoebophrya sp. A25]